MGYAFLEKINIGGVGIKNRVALLAMAKMLCSADNYVTDRYLSYYTKYAKNDVGLIIPGAMIIDNDWPSKLPFQPGIYHDQFLSGLRTLTEAVQGYGSKIFFQLWHPGKVPYTPGQVPKSINELSIDEIADIIGKYEAAAIRAKKVGADGIEIQLCHTYLGNQFLSKAFNQRTDEYGVQTLHYRMKFAHEVISRVKSASSLPVIVKLNGNDFAEDGITPNEAVLISIELEKLGADMISVSAGGALTDLTGMSSTGNREEGWKVPYAAQIKKMVNIPVMATGSIRHPRLADTYICEGKCDMIGLGRGLVAEPEWVKKAALGQEDDIRYCISCMNCFNYIPEGTACCSVNPYALREKEEVPLGINGDQKRVVVIGAGPAGLEAATTLAKRGYKVCVFEKDNKLGLMMRIAATPPDKSRIYWQLDYYEKQLQGLGIEMRYNTAATLSEIEALSPYAVVVATGSIPSIPPVPGCNRSNVLEVRDYLVDQPEIKNKKVLVVGAGQTGIETADMLAGMGNTVMIADMIDIPTTMRVEHKLAYQSAVKSGVQFYMKHRLEELGDSTATFINLDNNEEAVFDYDYVILSVGVKSNNTLFHEIEARFDRVYSIGDSNQIGKIADAVLAGNRIGCTL